MSREYDPLDVIPSADVLRRRIDREERLVARLRLLLGLAERVEATERETTPAEKEVAHA